MPVDHVISIPAHITYTYTFSWQNPNRGMHDLCHLSLLTLCAHLQAALQPIFATHAPNAWFVHAFGAGKTNACLQIWILLMSVVFQMQVSWFYLFTGISLGWFGFISSFFKYYRGKFGVISFVVSLYEQFYCTLWGSSSTSGLQIWYFNDFYIKSHHGGQELLHKEQRLLPLGFRIVYISISFVLF